MVCCKTLFYLCRTQNNNPQHSNDMLTRTQALAKVALEINEAAELWLTAAYNDLEEEVEVYSMGDGRQAYAIRAVATRNGYELAVFRKVNTGVYVAFTEATNGNEDEDLTLMLEVWGTLFVTR